MFYDQEVPIWAEVLETSDFPHDFELSFAAFVATCVSLVLPWSVTEALISKLAIAILEEKETQDFLIHKYLPELHEGVKHVNVSMTDKYHLFKKFIGVLIKILYAFAFQEHYLKIPGFSTPTMIKWGGKHVHIINSLADSLTEFP